MVIKIFSFVLFLYFFIFLYHILKYIITEAKKYINDNNKEN